MARRAWLFGLALALAAGAALAQAPPQPRISPQEAAQLATAAGFSGAGGAQLTNACGRPTRPQFAFADLNGDGRPEAIIQEVDVACHGGNGEKWSILQRDPAGRWALVGAVMGRLKMLETRTRGWRDYTRVGGPCEPTWGWDGAQYIIQRNCPAPGAAVATAPPAARPGAAAPAAVSAADKAAAFRAAGVAAVGGRYPACDKSQQMEIEFRDLNGDGRPDAVISDFGSFCYGATEQGFKLVTKEANGTWRKLYESPGIPTFLATRGVGGWPNIVNGGPGFCFPVMRWNGSDYAIIRFQAEQPGACAGRRP